MLQQINYCKTKTYSHTAEISASITTLYLSQRGRHKRADRFPVKKKNKFVFKGNYTLQQIQQHFHITLHLLRYLLLF